MFTLISAENIENSTILGNKIIVCCEGDDNYFYSLVEGGYIRSNIKPIPNYNHGNGFPENMSIQGTINGLDLFEILHQKKQELLENEISELKAKCKELELELLLYKETKDFIDQSKLLASNQ